MLINANGNFPLLVRKNSSPIAFPKTDLMFPDEYEKLPKALKHMYVYDSMHRIYKLPEKEWLKWRDHGPYYEDKINPNYVEYAVGGSEVSIVFDDSPWNSKLAFYHQKVGTELKIKRKKNTTTLDLGHIYEDAISEAFLLAYKNDYPKADIVKINDTRLFRCGIKNPDSSLKYPFALANIDRLVKINGMWGILEIKRTSKRNYKTIKKWKQGIIPKYYELQVRYYMAILNLPYAYICCSWGHELDDMVYIYIERNLKLEDMIMDTISEFVDCLKNHKEPDISKSNALLINKFYYELYGEANEDLPIVNVPPHYRSVITTAASIQESIEQEEKRITDLKFKKESVLSNLYPLFENRSFGICDINETFIAKVKLRTPRTRGKIDEDKLMIEQPTVYKKYCTKFDQTTFKKEQKLLVRKYVVPPKPSDEDDKKNEFIICLEEKGVV